MSWEAWKTQRISSDVRGFKGREENIRFEDIEVVLKELNLIVESELFVYDFDSVLAAQFCKKIL